ncbi:hypothetical protein G6F68_015740 [Rhizopus microsporus]|nr:hypothetical protein G6F68_015740 [Rhizopus microsporus]
MPFCPWAGGGDTAWAGKATNSADALKTAPNNGLRVKPCIQRLLIIFGGRRRPASPRRQAILGAARQRRKRKKLPPPFRPVMPRRSKPDLPAHAK